MKLAEVLEGIGSPVAVYPALSRMLGFRESGFLCQLIYWTGKGSNKEGWIYKSQADWTNELGLTRREQETIRRNLKSNGLIEERHERLRHRIYFRVNTERLEELWQVEKGIKTSSTDGGNVLSPMAETYIGEGTKRASGDGANVHSLLQRVLPKKTAKTTTTAPASRDAGGCGGDSLTVEKALRPSGRHAAPAEHAQENGSTPAVGAESTSLQQYGAKPQPPSSAAPPSPRKDKAKLFLDTLLKLRGDFEGMDHPMSISPSERKKTIKAFTELKWKPEVLLALFWWSWDRSDDTRAKKKAGKWVGDLHNTIFSWPPSRFFSVLDRPFEEFKNSSSCQEYLLSAREELGFPIDPEVVKKRQRTEKIEEIERRLRKGEQGDLRVKYDAWRGDGVDGGLRREAFAQFILDGKKKKVPEIKVSEGTERSSAKEDRLADFDRLTADEISYLREYPGDGLGGDIPTLEDISENILKAEKAFAFTQRGGQ